MPRPTILIVEDHPEICERIKKLVAAEYELAGVVARGDLALKTAGRLTPDIILLDVSLPGVGGLKILPKVRAILPAAVIIMLTNHDSPLYHREALDRGADAYVLKPEITTALLKSIRQARARR